MQLVFITHLPVLIWEEKAVLHLLNWNFNLIWNALGLEMKLTLLPLDFLPTSLYLNEAISLLRAKSDALHPWRKEQSQAELFPTEHSLMHLCGLELQMKP